MQRHKFARAFKFGSFFTLMLFAVLLTGTLHAAPKVGTVAPENSIIGQSTNDYVGSGGVYILPSGNVVVVSPYWNNYRGAVTCLTPDEYRAGGIVISASNSLVGSLANDYVGYGGILILNNGNYLVISSMWNSYRGAVTWVDGQTCFPHGQLSRAAVVSATNSLVGTQLNDQVGSADYGTGAVALTNGNYVVGSPYWDNGSVQDVGAATWGNGATGIAGTISATNSLIGSSQWDLVSGGDNTFNGPNSLNAPNEVDSVSETTYSSTTIVALVNGNYVVGSPQWDNGGVEDAGAATWGNGDGGTVGMIGADNSLIGASAYDQVGLKCEGWCLTALTNGNYVVSSPSWNNGSIEDAGAATWGDGETGVIGHISIDNSLIGLNTSDTVGAVFALTNGNYVVGSPYWDNGGLEDVGAATWGDGVHGTTGSIEADNSLIGSYAYDAVGFDVTALSNGNYAVNSPYWHNMRGAATWGDGNSGTVGIVSSGNSLIGATEGDYVGSGSAYWAAFPPDIALTNGNYLVVSPEWNSYRGAVTWGNGNGGTTGVVSPTNSLVGVNENDSVGGFGVHALTNGNYLVGASSAVAWGNGTTGTVGVVSAANSLDGASGGYQLYADSPVVLNNGNYLIRSYNYAARMSAATWGNGSTGTFGSVTPTNSLLVPTDELGVTPLNNGNFVFSAPSWDSTVQNIGAVFTVSGGITGVVHTLDAGNALIGSKQGDYIGFIAALPDGSYFAGSSGWDNGSLANVGILTWVDGTTPAPAPNTPPIVDSIEDQIAAEDELLTFSVHATDVDAPSQSLSYSMTGLPADASLNNSTGLFSWKPKETHGGQTFNVTVTAWDSGIPSLSSSTTFTISVNDINNYPPSIPTIANRTLYEGQTLTFNVSATDADTPAQSLTFSMTGAPTGASLNSTTGAFSFTAGESHGGQVFNVTVTATDSGEPALSGSRSFTITVNEVNSTPVVIAIANQTVNEGQSLSLDAEVIDSDLPAQTFTYSITGAPAGASFNTTTGEFAWTPGESNGGQTFNVTVTATDNGQPTRSDSEPFTITVKEVNTAPVLAQIGNQTVDEGQTLTFDAEATDSDLPAQTRTFSITGAPGDASFNTSTGVFSWTTDEADGGQTFNITVTVTDNGSPALSDSEAFTITVNEVNNAPILAEISDQTVYLGTMVTFDAEATDSDNLAQTLTYSIDGAPEDATFDTATGQFSWTTDESDGGQTLNVTLTVTDDGEPALSDSEAFTITVNKVNKAPVLATIGNKTVVVGATLTFDANATDADVPSQTLTYSITGALGYATFDPATGQFVWTPTEADGGQTINVTVTVTDNGSPALSDSEAFTITVNYVNNAPILATIGNKTVDVNATLTFDTNATDADAPAQTLTFSIDGAPEDATFDTATGAFSWTADEADGGQTFNVTVTVTDNGQTALSDSEDFTITVNPLVVEEINYLANYGFENAGAFSELAGGWKEIETSRLDRRACNTALKTYSHEGQCAYRFEFRGMATPARILQRNLNAKNFAKSDVVQLRSMAKAFTLTTGAKLVLKVVYNNGKTEVVSVKLPTGSYTYAPFATPKITLKRPVKKMTVQIKAGSAKGTFFVDDMAVVKVAAPLTIEGGTTDSGLRGLR